MAVNKALRNKKTEALVIIGLLTDLILQNIKKIGDLLPTLPKQKLLSD